MKKLAILLGGLALSALPAQSALADSIGFSFLGPDVSAAGTFTFISAGSPGKFLITGVTGTATVAKSVTAITGLAPVNGFAGNDNLYYTSGAAQANNAGRPFDFFGFGFNLANGNALNLFSDAGKDFELLGVLATGQQLLTNSVPITFGPGTGTSTGVTPEPGSLVLLGTGALGVFGVLRRRFAL